LGLSGLDRILKRWSVFADQLARVGGPPELFNRWVAESGRLCRWFWT
jgi:hypothetical protein